MLEVEEIVETECAEGVLGVGSEERDEEGYSTASPKG